MCFGRRLGQPLGRQTGERPRADRRLAEGIRVHPHQVGEHLLAFEDAANGDYQDYVFVLSNAGP
jgi:hypothetical protein